MSAPWTHNLYPRHHAPGLSIARSPGSPLLAGGLAWLAGLFKLYPHPELAGPCTGRSSFPFLPRRASSVLVDFLTEKPTTNRGEKQWTISKLLESPTRGRSRRIS